MPYYQHETSWEPQEQRTANYVLWLERAERRVLENRRSLVEAQIVLLHGEPPQVRKTRTEKLKALDVLLEGI